MKLRNPASLSNNSDILNQLIIKTKSTVNQDETARLSALNSYNILDTAPEEDFDALTRLASYICQSPISLVSLIDSQRQWFKSRLGLDVPETPRDISFCQYAIQQDDVFQVKDATKNDIFK